MIMLSMGLKGAALAGEISAKLCAVYSTQMYKSAEVWNGRRTLGKGLLSAFQVIGSGPSKLKPGSQ
jgi:hypothetical protein